MNEEDVTAQRIRDLEKELSQVPYMGVNPAWNEQSSPEETRKYFEYLMSLKFEKDLDSPLWRKIVRWD